MQRGSKGWQRHFALLLDPFSVIHPQQPWIHGWAGAKLECRAVALGGGSFFLHHKSLWWSDTATFETYVSAHSLSATVICSIPRPRDGTKCHHHQVPRLFGISQPCKAERACRGLQITSPPFCLNMGGFAMEQTTTAECHPSDVRLWTFCKADWACGDARFGGGVVKWEVGGVGLREQVFSGQGFILKAKK